MTILVDRQMLPSAPRAALEDDANRESVPNEPPFIAFMGNLPYDIDDEVGAVFDSVICLCGLSLIVWLVPNCVVYLWFVLDSNGPFKNMIGKIGLFGGVCLVVLGLWWGPLGSGIWGLPLPDVDELV